MAKRTTELRQLEKMKALRLERAQRVAWRRSHPSYLHGVYLPQQSAWPISLVLVSALHIFMACAIIFSAVLAGDHTLMRWLYAFLCGVIGVGLFFHAPMVRRIALAAAVFQCFAIYAVVAYGVASGTALVGNVSAELGSAGLLAAFAVIAALSTTANTWLVLGFAMVSVFALTRDSLKSSFGIPSWM